MHQLCQSRTIAHSLGLLEEVKFHLIHSLYLVYHPLLGLALLQHFYVVEHIAYNFLDFVHSLV